MDVWKLLDVADKLITVLILFGGLLTFLFRSWISEWIRTRFSRTVGQYLETYKHQLSRDLEAYKGALIRELEGFKANLDIKRSIALKLADVRLEATQSIAFEFDRYINEAVTMLAMTAEMRQRNLVEYNDATIAMRQARRKAAVFLPSKLLNDIVLAYSDANALVTQCLASNTILSNSDERITRIFNRSIPIDAEIRSQLYKDPVSPGSMTSTPN